MATMLSVTINAPPNPIGKLSGEVGFLLRVLDEVKKELGRGQGTVASGTILTYDTSLDSPITQGTWTYTPVATLP
jgi:hypothetical protein